MEFVRRLIEIEHADPNIRRRGRLLAIVLLGMIVASVIPMPFALMAANPGLLIGILSACILLYCVALWLVRRAHVTLVAWIVSLNGVVALGSSVFVGRTFVALVFLTLFIIVAGLVLPPRQIWGTLLLMEGGIAVAALTRPEWLSDPFNSEVLICVALLLAFVTLFSYLGADAIQRAIDSSEASAQHATAAQRIAETQASDLAAQAEVLRQTEQQLQNLVATLETPTVALTEGVLLAPLVGALDSRRARLLTERLLHDVAGQRVRLLVLDVAGVALIDTGVAHALTGIVQAVRLLGCQVVVTGIAPGVAITLTSLGVSLSGIQTARSPQEVLASLSGQAGAARFA